MRYGASDPHGDVPKKSAWVEVEGVHRGGHFTIWQSGEVEAEVHDVASLGLVFSRSEVVHTPDQMGDLLLELVKEVRHDDE